MFALTLLGAAATLWYQVALPRGTAALLNSPVGTSLLLIGMCGLAGAGYLLARARPRSTMAWLMVVTACAWVWSYLVVGLAITATAAALPGSVALAWMTNWVWVPAQVLSALTLLRFPDGRLPGPRWRWVERSVLGWGAVTVLTTALLPGPLGSESLSPTTNPVGLSPLAGLLDGLLAVTFALLPAVVLAAAAAPVLRWRAAGRAERRQLLWVAAVAVALAASAPLSLLSGAGELLQGLAYLLLPGAIAAAVLREQLWDLDLHHRFDRLRATRLQERERLRHDLHDSLGPLLGSVSMRAEAGRNLLHAGDTGRVDTVLADIGDVVDEALTEVRRLIDELGPSALVEHDLAEALREHVATYDGTFPVTLVPGSDPGLLDPRVSEAAYLIAIEAVRNAARHSGAPGCEVRIEESAGALVVTVTDRGRGMTDAAPGVGRRAMARRAESVGGRLTVTAADGGGSTVRAELPGSRR